MSPPRVREEDALRDTGHPPKIPDEKLHMSTARFFDNLVDSNLQLVKTIRVAIGFIVVCSLVSTIMTACSAITLFMGQSETRSLLAVISKKNCAETISTPSIRKE